MRPGDTEHIDTPHNTVPGGRLPRTAVTPVTLPTRRSGRGEVRARRGQLFQCSATRSAACCSHWA
ncbi:hypothetical protein GA0070623_0963 [Micromonospora rifamycinica]|uniref:Uncharacterized protein n=1 Tax=Micromonospora rifamycinica TaxID=291594 RepID=A0A1C5HAG8_9ACTN|nr:hypothetical protein GA0070623_0963 [Micromonospora rifamycinica]